MAAVFGLVFIIIIPPFQGADEPLHFYRAYQVSTFNFVVDENVGRDFGGVLPSSLENTVALTANNSNLGNLKPNEKYNIHTTSEALSIKETPSQREWVNFTATAPYPPVAYIPQATGVLIARILRAPPILMMYAGRLMNLTAWIVLLALSIKIMPRKKWAFVFIGLLPVALTQAASLSADVMTIGLFALFFATIMRSILRTKPFTNLELAGLLLIMVLLVLCKQISFVFLPLLLLIPSKAFGSKRKAYAIKAVFLLVSLAIYTTWLYIIRDLNFKSVFANHENPTQQIHLIIHNPLGFINALWDSYFFSWGDVTTKSFIGTFGWGDTSLSELIVTMGYIGLFLVATINPYNHLRRWVTKRQKIWLGIMGIVYWLAITATLYAYYNPVGAKTILGLQGRYFLPLGFIAIPLLYSNWLKSSKTAYKKIAVLVPLFLLLTSVVTIYFRYYINYA